MPAIITHHLYGEEAAKRLPADLTLEGEDLLAFLLGCQGADPYYVCFTATPMLIRTCHSFGEKMHDQPVVDALVAARDSVAALPPADRGVGHAFVLGLLAHYLLDSEAHAFIGAQEQALCDADAELEDARDQVHALIESDLDTWMLWSARHQTVEDAPAWADLARTERLGRVAGAIFSQVAWQVHGISLGASAYEGCLRDYELIYHAIDPLGNPRGTMLAGAERLGARYSRLRALAHAANPGDTCPAANLDCHPWLDPLTGTERHTSFPDIFYDSLGRWPALVEALVQDDRAALERLVRRNYDGTPLA